MQCKNLCIFWVATDLDIACNTNKTVCMVLKPLHKDRVVANDFPCFTHCGVKLKFVEQFRHLGHILSNSLNDDDDIKREIQNLYIRTNMVISRFRRCSTRVERILFKSYCLCFYDIALWKHYSVTVLSKFKSCYHKCIKKLFGFSRSDSMSGILIQLSLPSFDTIIHNSRISFERHCSSSENTVTMHLCNFS